MPSKWLARPNEELITRLFPNEVGSWDFNKSRAFMTRLVANRECYNTFVPAICPISRMSPALEQDVKFLKELPSILENNREDRSIFPSNWDGYLGLLLANRPLLFVSPSAPLSEGDLFGETAPDALGLRQRVAQVFSYEVGVSEDFRESLRKDLQYAQQNLNEMNLACEKLDDLTACWGFLNIAEVKRRLNGTNQILVANSAARQEFFKCMDKYKTWMKDVFRGQTDEMGQEQLPFNIDCKWSEYLQMDQVSKDIVFDNGYCHYWMNNWRISAFLRGRFDEGESVDRRHCRNLEWYLRIFGCDNNVFRSRNGTEGEVYLASTTDNWIRIGEKFDAFNAAAATFRQLVRVGSISESVYSENRQIELEKVGDLFKGFREALGGDSTRQHATTGDRFQSSADLVP